MSRTSAKPRSGATSAGQNSKRSITNPAFNPVPSTLAVAPELPVLATANLISHFQGLVYDITDDPSKSSTVELSEAYERLGMTQFYYGSLRAAIDSLQKSLDARKKLPFARNNVRTALALALACYRTGDLERAEKTLVPLPAQAVKSPQTSDLAVACFGNLALICLVNAKPKEAVDNAKRGLEFALQQSANVTTSASTASDDASNHRTQPPTSPPLVLDLVRILLTVYIKGNELSKAENLFFEYTFPEEEGRLLHIALSFATSKIKEAQRVFDEMTSDREDQIEKALFSVQVPFNRAALSSRAYDYDNSKKLLQTSLECINDFIRAADVEGLADGDVLEFFFNADINVSPPVRSFEQSLRPLVLNSHILAVRGELELLSSTSPLLSPGAAVQAGGLLAGVALMPCDEPEEMAPDPPEITPFLDQVQLPTGAQCDNKFKCSVERSKSLLTESLQTLVKSPFVRRNDRESDGGGGVEEVKEEESENAEEKGSGDVDAKLLDTIGLYDALSANNRSISYHALLSAMDSNGNYSSVAKQARSDLKKVYGIQLNDRGIKGSVVGGAKADTTSKIYCPNKHDALTLGSDILPMLSHSGRNDISLWLQWAVSSSGGLGLGSLGSPFAFPKSATVPKREDEKKSSAAGPPQPKPLQPSPNELTLPNENLLKEVKSRIYEVEGGMANKFDGAESKYRPGDKESRVLLNAVLAKICFQLNLRRDCELAVETMEILTADMKHYSQNMDYCYIALARRFRFDREEMKIPGSSSAEGHAAKLQALLVHAKSYLSAAERTTDTQLLRDALKKIMNIYTDFASIAYPDQMPAGYNLPPGESYPPAPGTREMLQAFTSAEINEREKTDSIWLRKFGKCRALLMLERYQALLA